MTALMVLPLALFAQEQEPPKPAGGAGLSDEEIKKANNPMASTKALNLHTYLVSKLYGIEDASMSQMIVRYAQPVGRVLIRASMPFVVSSEAGKSPTTGTGDFNIFGIYSRSTKSGNQFGIGPTITAPTASHNLGSGKWQGGIAILAFMASNRLIQWGGLLQWQASFAGQSDRDEVNTFFPQIFAIWQIGGGTYLRSTGIWTFNLRNGEYSVPVGLGVGKVVKVNKIVFNIFAEPQFTVLANGIGQPKYQTFVGFNTQF
ncbi:hypothetical protein FPE01S_01_06630 [Flavihumibacter petaseus NBRC 106054]|uniref:Transporter n=2 Tax=Flavihumibacter TaxID=1004301 RepID=A0A0E9MVP0_9BACT|nr:hypothetical protein FPE01S_01_06630 [Flavihumibacter petaseus NBRC 106054]